MSKELAVAEEALEAWGKEERSVTLTNDEWSKLTVYILMTTQHRKREIETWERLSTEKKEDGTPKFENAKSNAEFWRETDSVLEQIKRKIDG